MSLIQQQPDHPAREKSAKVALNLANSLSKQIRRFKLELLVGIPLFIVARIPGKRHH
jgi:hypothetical protein